MTFCAKMLNNSLHLLKKGTFLNITYYDGAKGKATHAWTAGLASLDPICFSSASSFSSTKNTFFLLKQSIQLVCLHLKKQLKEEKQNFLLWFDSHIITQSTNTSQVCRKMKSILKFCFSQFHQFTCLGSLVCWKGRILKANQTMKHAF